MKTNKGLLALVVAASWLPSAFAQLEVGGGLTDNCAQIEGLRKGGDLSGARDKANLCLQGLEQQLQSDVGKNFPADVAGWKRTGLDQGEALGFTNISATYKKGEQTATVSLTGGATGGGALGGLLGGIARMGAQAGQQVRIGGLPGSVQTDGSINVTLENGSILSFASPSFHDQASALAGLGDLVNAFPVADINKMLH